MNENSLKMVTWKIWCVLESLLNYLENEKVQAFQTLFCVISFKNGVIVFFKRKLIPWEKENNLLWEFETKLVSVQMRDILTAATVYGLNTDQSKIWLPDEKNTVKCESSSYYGLYTSLFTRQYFRWKKNGVNVTFLANTYLCLHHLCWAEGREV